MKGLGFKFQDQMGGNCTAWIRPEKDDGYALLTIEGGGLAPESLDDVSLIGWYVPDVELPVRHETGVLRDLLERGVLAPE